MTLTTYDDYYDFYVPKIDKYPQRDDFLKVLEWVADKPGQVSGFGELALVIDADKDPSGQEMVSRVLAVSVILTGWEQQIADPLLKVKSANGQLYEVGVQERDVYDGKKPLVLEATGETINDFKANAYMHVRFRAFEPRLAAQPAPIAGLKC
ncbi:hypothetical protein HFN89_02240 [Rhizobium laguerreae]|nr:hypothetical protein [Rhizobium laguerreae]